MADLPRGTVTFLLTDIEGSTGLWERDPEAMRQAIVRRDALLAAVIEGRGGHVIRTKGEGDRAFAVFARASNALAAARLRELVGAPTAPSERERACHLRSETRDLLGPGAFDTA